MSMSLPHINEEVFIDVVKKYPVIYRLDSSNISERENAWSEIASTVEHPVSVCKRKWNCLRATFRRAHRLKHNDLKDTTWRHYRRLQFLLPHTRSSQEIKFEMLDLLEKQQKENQSDTPSEPSRESKADTIPSDIDENAFIELVKLHPMLYDDAHPDYTNRNQREFVWNDIATIVDKPAHVCKRKWLVLRTSFRRARKGPGPKVWRHYKKMNFLVPFIKDEVKNKMKTRFKTEPKDKDLLEMVDGDLNSFDSDNNTSNEVDEVNHKEETGSQINNQVQNTTEKIDANLQFFNSMATAINLFPTEHQVRIKMMLLKAVSEVQLLLKNLPSPDYPVDPFKN